MDSIRNTVFSNLRDAGLRIKRKTFQVYCCPMSRLTVVPLPWLKE